MSLFFSCLSFFPQQPTEYFDMGIFLAFFVVVSLVCLILLIKIKLKQRRSQVRLANTRSAPSNNRRFQRLETPFANPLYVSQTF